MRKRLCRFNLCSFIGYRSVGKFRELSRPALEKHRAVYWDVIREKGALIDAVPDGVMERLDGTPNCFFFGCCLLNWGSGDINGWSVSWNRILIRLSAAGKWTWISVISDRKQLLFLFLSSVTKLMGLAEGCECYHILSFPECNRKENGTRVIKIIL